MHNPLFLPRSSTFFVAAFATPDAGPTIGHAASSRLANLVSLGLEMFRMGESLPFRRRATSDVVTIRRQSGTLPPRETGDATTHHSGRDHRRGRRAAVQPALVSQAVVAGDPVGRRVDSLRPMVARAAMGRRPSRLDLGQEAPGNYGSAKRVRPAAFAVTGGPGKRRNPRIKILAFTARHLILELGEVLLQDRDLNAKHSDKGT